MSEEYRTFGKVVLVDRGIHTVSKEKMKFVLVAGVVGGDLLPENDGTSDLEMWEGEIIFIPSRKYRGHKCCKAGGNITDVLTGGDYHNPDMWKECIYQSEE